MGNSEEHEAWQKKMDAKPEEQNSEPMLPDIVVSNPDDRRTVIAALFKYCEYLGRAVYISGEVDYVAREYGIVSRLVKALRDQEATEAAEEVLTDPGIAEFMRGIRDQFGRESGPDGY